MGMRHALLVCVVVFGLNSPCWAATVQDSEAIRAAADKMLSEVPEKGYHLTADEVMAKIQSGEKDFVIVDCRETEAKYKAGHIPGAIHINFRDIAKSESLAKLPMDKDVILYCNTGHEENKALGALRMLGYKAYGLKFGYSAWKKGKPSEAMVAAIANADTKNFPEEK